MIPQNSRWLCISTLLVIATLCFSLAQADAKARAPTPAPSTLESIYLDPYLTDRQRVLLKTVKQDLNRWKVQKATDPNPILSSAYALVFGSEIASPISFIVTRVKAIFAPDPESRTPGLSAVNVGFGKWLELMVEDPTLAPQLNLGKKVVRFQSTRVGILQLGDGFDSSNQRVGRAATLIHEARHSDCPDGLDDQGIVRLRGLSDLLDQIATGEVSPGSLEGIRHAVGTCGFTHVNCPVGHELAGYTACDAPEGWGAYAIEALYARKLYRDCVNCSEGVKAEALVIYTNAAARVDQWEKLTRGTLGKPDMRHQGYHAPIKN